MSNCIVVDTNILHFRNDEVHVPNFRALLDSVKGITQSEAAKWFDSGLNEEDLRKFYAWWFLERNTQIDDQYGVTIHLGAGRSGHTQRDFRGLMNDCLSHFVLKPLKRSFLIRDEFDGFKKQEVLNWELMDKPVVVI